MLMRVREETYWQWADAQLHSRSHDEALSDGTTLDVQVRLSRANRARAEDLQRVPLASTQLDANGLPIDRVKLTGLDNTPATMALLAGKIDGMVFSSASVM